jgi:hypothetical protein
MFRRIALCAFALGTVAGLAVAALCVPLAYGGDWGPFGVSVGTAALFIVSLVVNLDTVGRPTQPPRQAALGG